MQLATIKANGFWQVAIVGLDEQRVWPLGNDVAESMLDLIDRSRGEHPRITREGPGLSISEVEIGAPIPRPRRNIFCIGKNYADHAHEFSNSGYDSSARSPDDSIPISPIVFSKVPESVIGPGSPIRNPFELSQSIDYEAELAVVIGKGGRGIRRDQAYEHVWGYTIINDVTARDLQSQHGQWLIGKSLDTFCPMGPWLVTADEVDPENLQIRCWVNGELRQDANTHELIFDIPALIESISAGITLQPGDIIATGTPAGVGIGFTPPKFLNCGDEITIEIDGLGRLSNRLQ